MQWENLTGPEFARAVKQTSVCLLPMGVMERHGDHLPLGTDVFVIHKLCCLAAEKEPAVVFPPWFFGQIYEARAFPGCLTVKPTMLLELIQTMCDEIGRNGFKKILFVNGHGGNKNLLPFIAQCSLWEPKPYSIYVPDGKVSAERQREWDAALKTSEHGHACECETSHVLALFPELVKMKALPEKPASALKRMSEAPGVFTGVSWYADYPDHYAGDARAASAETGRILVKLRVDSLVELIKLVKADKVAPALEAEFHARAADPCGRKAAKR